MNRQTLMAAAALLVAGCAHQVERPEAYGLIHDPEPVPAQDLGALDQEILAAALPDGRRAEPTGPVRDDAAIAASLRAIDAQLAAGDTAGARVQLQQLSDRLHEDLRRIHALEAAQSSAP